MQLRISFAEVFEKALSQAGGQVFENKNREVGAIKSGKARSAFAKGEKMKTKSSTCAFLRIQ